MNTLLAFFCHCLFVKGYIEEGIQHVIFTFKEKIRTKIL